MLKFGQAGWDGCRRFGRCCLVRAHAFYVWLVPVVLIEHVSPMGPGAKVAFELAGKQGAVLMTSHLTYLERFERKLHFQAYTKNHYESWVDFCVEQGHGDNIKPVLVTGVELTKAFSAMAYSDNRTHVECEFSVDAPAGGSVSLSAWGSWSNPGLVHTNSGPTLRHTPAIQSADESPVSTSVVPEDHNQCVFIRYYTIRKKFSVPLLTSAGAGPHQLLDVVREDDMEAGMFESSDSDSDFSFLEPGQYVVRNVPPVSAEHRSALTVPHGTDQG